MYGLGATLYHMVTGRIPFGECAPMVALNKHIAEYLPNPGDIDPSISPGVAQVIARLMMKDPADRHRDWAGAILEIKKAASGRVLLKKQGAAGAVSTVAPQKIKVPCQVRQAGRAVPLWVRLPAWGLLLAWCLFLAYTLHTPPPAQIEKRDSGSIGRQIQEHDIPGATAKPQIPEVKARQDMKESGPGPSDNVNDERQYLLMFKENVARCVLGEEFDKAIALIDRELEYSHSQPFQREMNNIRKFIRDIAQMNNMVQSAFRDRVGQEMVINQNSRKHTLVIRSVTGDTVHATLVAGTNMRPVSLSVAQLPPAESSRLIGHADTPVKNAIKCVLHMKGGDYESAQVFAANAGPLSDALTNQTKFRSGFSRKK